MVGDGESAALISRAGSVDWLCWPRFDSAACLAALLGDETNGHWAIEPAAPDDTTVTRRYRPDTLILETNFAAPGGHVRVIDFMPMREDVACLIRIVEGVAGECPMHLTLRPRFAYGTLLPWLEIQPHGVTAMAGPDRLTLYAPIGLTQRDHGADAEFRVRAGQRLVFVLQHSASSLAEPVPVDGEAALTRTETFWRGWIGRFDAAKTRWPERVKRSLITLKALIYRPAGGLVAAPTTSLPEAPGGKMNWDYRYCWLRDSTFTLGALINAGYHDEAHAWRAWLLRAIGGSPDSMRIMYRVDGDRHLDEWCVAGLPGYRHALPVRVGNAASTQLQLDVWGEVLDTFHLADIAGLPPCEHAKHLREALTEHLAGIWQNPGAGLWESRKEPRHYTYSRVMAWVGIDRYVRAHGSDAGKDSVRRMMALRDRIHREVCRDGWNDGIGAFTQYFGGQTLDASVLLLPLVGFLPATDPRMARTIDVIGRELGEGGLIRRTRPDEDGMPEGAFLACSCWMADCLNAQGRADEAAAQFERVTALSNDVGLLSEEYNVPGQHLAGNFPQALTHLAVVNTGLGLSGPVINRGGG
jgi:GH15 family glucan-1,4-alpha-glucosidase